MQRDSGLQAVRYENAEDLLRLAWELQGSRVGLRLADIEQIFGVSRRTAERMRDAARRLFPQVEELLDDEGFKRWRLPSGTLKGLFSVSADELAALEAAAGLAERDNLGDIAAQVRMVAAKVRAALAPQVLGRLEPDLEALTEAEGLARRPGPRPLISTDVLDALREAIKGAAVVRIGYVSRSTGLTSRQTVHPYGFLYGNRHYLVAYSTGTQGMRLFSLANIREVETLAEGFARREDFSLHRYADQSFGVFQEDPFDVVWRVAPEAAADARDYLFHPHQQLEDQDDGSLLVRFRAGGHVEMCWHLFTWNGAIEVIEPHWLRHRFREMCAGIAAAIPVTEEE